MVATALSFLLFLSAFLAFAPSLIFTDAGWPVAALNVALPSRTPFAVSAIVPVVGSSAAPSLNLTADAWTARVRFARGIVTAGPVVSAGTTGPVTVEVAVRGAPVAAGAWAGALEGGRARGPA